MKVKEKIIEQLAGIEISCDESVRVNDLGRRVALLTFHKARELIADKFDAMADCSFEGFNQGDMTFEECRRQEMKLREYARIVLKVGEDEVEE